MANDLATRNALVAKIVDALAKEQYERVIAMAPTSRVGAAELRTAVREYGRTLLPLPEHEWKQIDYIEVAESEPMAWYVVVPLFTVEEGLSDLSLELTLVAGESCKYEVEIDNLHVL